MWICLNDAFLSAVQHARKPSMLVVRARNPEHLEMLFPKSKVSVTEGSDYAARVVVSKKKFAAFLVEEVGRITYPNFKDSVKDQDLHDAYLRMWVNHKNYQTGLEKEKPEWNEKQTWNTTDATSSCGSWSPPRYQEEE